MSTASTAPIPEAPSAPKQSLVPSDLHPLNLFPSWLLWFVIFWENWVNLRLNAPYTDKFLAAPLFVALAKFALLGGVAILPSIVRSLISRGKLDFDASSRALLRNWLDCWFLSAVTMVAFNGLLNPSPKFELTPAAKNLDANPDPIFGIFAGTLTGPIGHDNFWLAVGCFASYTLFSLAVGTVIYLIVNVIVKLFAGNLKPITAPYRVHLGIFTQLLLIALSYSFLNGLFATVIRM